MKTFSTIILFFLFLTLSVHAQIFPSDVWHQGRAVLVNDDTLQGMIKYDIPKNSLQVKLRNETVLAFSAQNLFFFEIFDEGIKSYRQFYSLPYHVGENYSVPQIFEVLYEGRLTLLCRERIAQIERDRQIRGSNLAGTLPNDARLILAFDFYFLEKDGTINLYEPKKRRLLSIMDRKYTEVKKYIKRNNLRYDHIRDLVRITAYYNALEIESAKLK